MFGFGGSEKLDAAKVPKITDALTPEINGHNHNIWQNTQMYRYLSFGFNVSLSAHLLNYMDSREPHYFYSRIISSALFYSHLSIILHVGKVFSMEKYKAVGYMLQWPLSSTRQ